VDADATPPWRIIDPVRRRTYAHLSVQSATLSAGELGHLIGLVPDETWRMGEGHPAVSIPRAMA
jgi:hypothetical protein